jgi:hypothetical protein
MVKVDRYIVDMGRHQRARAISVRKLCKFVAIWGFDLLPKRMVKTIRLVD